MNIKNLKKAMKFISTLPADKFDMRQWRNKYDHIDHNCNSVGCIIGWCTALDTPENLDKFRFSNGEIHFEDWSEHFFEVNYDSNVWDYLFSSYWSDKDTTNTPEHAIYRIKNILDGYKPEAIEFETAKY